ncbi:uncharacterized protein [Periplaneta americana]|uniref:uncharacterized protein n=1 Tax=Periplaneta americana TaxID=6978 RepID=UPI0037E8C61F
MLDSLSEWILFASIVTLILYLLSTWTHNHFYKMNVYHLKPVPFVGNMGPVLLGKLSFPDFINDKYKKMEGHKYGGMYEFMNPLIMIRDPDLIKTVTIKDFEFFLDHRNPIGEEIDPVIGRGLLNLNGQKWKDMRSTLSPAFTSSKMKTMFTLITECGEQLGDFLKTCIKDKNMPLEGCKIEREGDMLVVEMKNLFTRYTNDVIATSAFGIGCDSLNKPKNEFFEMGRDITNFGGIRSLILFGYLMSPRLMKLLNVKFMSDSVCNFFRSLVHDTMATREAKDIFRPDMIHLLMQAKKETVQANVISENASKPKWDADDLTAQAVIFFFAGFDTASTLLCFASHLLATHPDVQSRLQKEIDETLENDGGKLTYEAVHSMKYLDMVISEALRLYPPAVATDRKCIKTYTIQSDPPCIIQPGQGLWIPVYALHHDPKYFPNPQKFDPERFSDENKDSIKPCTYLPFGSGPRSCIGNRFALMESKIALVHLLTRFNLKVVSKTPIPIQISKKGFKMTVDGGFWLGLEQRVIYVSNFRNTKSATELRKSRYFPLRWSNPSIVKMLDSLSEWILAAGFVTLIAYVIGTWTHSHFYKMNVYHLKPIPFFGNMAPVVLGWRSFPDFINDVYKKLKGHKYGGVYQFMTPLIVITDPELIKTIAIKDFEFFLDHRNPITEDVEPLLGKGLFNLKGQKWKDMRSTLSPGFTSSKMKTMFTLITECGEQLGDFLKTCIKDKNMPVDDFKIEREGDMLVVEMKDLFTRYTNDVIATSAFGIGCDSLNKPKNEFYEMMKDVTNFGGVRALIFFGFMFSPKLMKLLNLKFMSKAALNFFRTLVHDTIATREAKNIFRPDMIHILMQAKKETVQPSGINGEASKPKWDDDDLTAQAVNFFFGGFDTSSVLLCFASHLLATHPDVQNRLQTEIDETLENDGGKLTYEAVHGMKYLDMVVSETLRLYPPVLGTDRKCIKTYTFKSDPPCTMEPDQSVWIPVYCLHRDPKYFPNPEKFDPERFSDENKDNIKPYTYLPFGLGPRSCIGNRFVLMEAKIALVHLLTRFNLKVVSKTPIPIRISKRGFNMAVDGGFWLGIEQRAI